MDKEKKFYSTKRKFINDGVFRAEVNELLQKAFADFGFSGIEVNFSKGKTEVRVLVSKFNKLMRRELTDTTTSIRFSDITSHLPKPFKMSTTISSSSFETYSPGARCRGGRELSRERAINPTCRTF